MKRFTLVAICFWAVLLFGINEIGYAQFTSGNLVVLRAGDGSAPLSSASTVVFFEEYTTIGASVQTVAVPSTGTNMLTIAGNSGSEGFITVSPDSYYLVVPGYNAVAGIAAIAGTTSATVNRKLLKVDNTVTYTPLLSSTAYSGGNIRGGVTYLDNFWASGSNGGVQYFGTGTPCQVSSTVANVRAINIFNGQLYFSTGSGTTGIYAVGTGLPILTGQTSTVVVSTVGTGTGTASSYSFAFNSTSDICYIADDRSSANGGGIQKFIKTAGVWAISYTISVGTVGARGLTVDWTGANPVIYTTTAEASVNRLVKIIDVGSSSTYTLLSTAGTNTAYRGVAFSPIVAGTPAPTIPAQNITFSGISTSAMTASWTNGNGAKRIVIMNTTNSFTNPVDGTDPAVNTVYGGSGEQVVYNNTGSSVSVTGLNPSTLYWFRVYEYNGTGATTKYLTTTATGNPNSQATSAAAVAPSISLPTSASITNTTAVLGGTITSDGGSAILERGTVWKTSPGVAITDNKLAEGGTTVATFSHTRSSLPVKTHIFYKAYATNSVGTNLTPEASFYTLANEPTSHVTGFTALSGGTTSINLTWSTAATGADGYLILQKTGPAAPTGIPADATGYTVGSVLGDGNVAALVTPGSSLATAITGLSPATTYSYTIIPFAWDGSNNATYNYYTAPTIPSASATTTGTGPSTYTWQGANNGLWTTATNWNPTRTVVASTDILQFNDGTTKTVTAVPTETFGQLIMANNTTINLQSSAAAILTINGLTGTDLVIPAGCALNMNAANTITLAVATTATGSISGNMTFSSSVATAHRLTAADPGGITFNNGSVFTAGTLFSGNPFGTTSLGSIIFAGGSTFIQQAGSNPFGAGQPSSVVVFQTGSLFKVIANLTPAFSGRTYANFEMDAPAVTLTPTGGAPVSMDNLTVTNGTMNFNVTGPTSGIHQIKGNIVVAAGGILNFSPASASTVTLNGTGAQSISGAGPITGSANSTLEIANSNGVSMNTMVTLNGKLKLTSGLLTLGSSNLVLGTAATITGTPSASAMVVATGTGQLQKGFATGFTGSFVYPVGDNTVTPEYSPVTLNFTSGTFAAGNNAGVNLVNSKYPTDPNFISYLRRYWNLSQSGITGFSCNATFQYVPADVNGTENQISTTLVNPTPYFAYDLANTSLHQLTASGLTSFGTYTGTQMPPTVVSTAATAVGANIATVNGTVKANNLSTSVNFEYGLTTGYGSMVAAVPATVTGNTVTSVSANLTGLTQNTLYHYRVMGVNLTGIISYGADLTFTTACPVPGASGSVTGLTSVCSPGTGYVYFVAAITNAATYIWTVPPGANITAGGNTNSITVSYPAGAASGNVSVYGSSICGNGTASPNLAVTVHALPVPTITGTNSLCINSGYYNYTTETGMTNYAWTVSAGGVINFGSGTNQVTVSWVGAGAQTIRVSYTSAAGCAAAAPTIMNITVNPFPGPAGIITGIPSVCAGASGFNYSVAPIANAASYVWSLPSGATITSGSGTNAIVVSYSNSAVSGNITVQGNNLCGSGTISPSYPVIVVQLPGAAGTIMGNNPVCEGDAGFIYTVLPISDATGYVWTIPAGAIIVAGTNTNIITVNFPAGASSGTMTVYGTDFCGNGTVSPNFAITVKPVPPAPVITAVLNTLTSSAATGNQWYFNGLPITGATGQTYVADQSGNYSCQVTLDGCSSAMSNVINIIITGTGGKNVAETIGVYPVPSDGKFTVTFPGSSNETYTISVLNNLGVKIYEETMVDVNTSFRKVIDLRPIQNGVYSIIFDNNQKHVVRKIIINK